MIPPIIVAAYGQNGLGKTTFGLGAPKPLLDLETDIGSYDRAVPFMDIAEGDVTLEQLYVPKGASPLPLDLLNEGATKQARLQLEGWQELEAHIISAYNKGLMGNYASIMIDTATRNRAAFATAYLEMVQDAARAEKKDPRQQLANRVEYTIPSAKERRMYDEVKLGGVKKNLILLCHETVEYRDDQATNIPKLQGFGEILNIADVVMRFTTEDDNVVAVLQKCLGLPAPIAQKRTMKLVDPTWDKLVQFIECLRALRLAGIPLPETAEEIMEQGGALL